MVLPQAMAWVQYWFRILSLKFCGKSKKFAEIYLHNLPLFACMSIVLERVWFLVGIFTKGSRTKRKSINAAPDYEYGDVWTIFCVPLVARRGVRKKYSASHKVEFSLEFEISKKGKQSFPFPILKTHKKELTTMFWTKKHLCFWSKKLYGRRDPTPLN